MNKTPKIKWKVGEKPTGMYRAFQSREWPTACYVVGDRYAFSISCEDEYRPADVKSGKHAELKLHIADYRGDPKNPNAEWKRCTLLKRFATLSEAKTGAISFMQAHPEFLPKDLQVNQGENHD